MAVYEQGFENFGPKQIEWAAEQLTMFSEGKLTPIAEAYFDPTNVKVAFNDISELVFITNDDYQVIMDNSDGQLDLFITTGWSGKEGFLGNHIDSIDWDSDDYELDDLEEILSYEEYLDRDEIEILRNAIQEKTK